jgi:hypothetical protein
MKGTPIRTKKIIDEGLTNHGYKLYSTIYCTMRMPVCVLVRRRSYATNNQHGLLQILDPVFLPNRVFADRPIIFESIFGSEFLQK